MKSKLKLSNMNNMYYVDLVNNAIRNIQGIIDCKINLGKKEVEIIYDEYFLNENRLLEIVEDIEYDIL